jgi:hypothetical protein
MPSVAQSRISLTQGQQALNTYASARGMRDSLIRKNKGLDYLGATMPGLSGWCQERRRGVAQWLILEASSWLPAHRWFPTPIVGPQLEISAAGLKCQVPFAKCPSGNSGTWVSFFVWEVCWLLLWRRKHWMGLESWTMSPFNATQWRTVSWLVFWVVMTLSTPLTWFLSPFFWLDTEDWYNTCLCLLH